jgi:hypothetical protein
VSVSVCHFHPGLIFASIAGACYINGRLIAASTNMRKGVVVNSSDKHSSILLRGINFSHKCFIGAKCKIEMILQNLVFVLLEIFLYFQACWAFI